MEIEEEKRPKGRRRRPEEFIGDRSESGWSWCWDMRNCEKLSDSVRLLHLCRSEQDWVCADTIHMLLPLIYLFILYVINDAASDLQVWFAFNLKLNYLFYFRNDYICIFIIWFALSGQRHEWGSFRLLCLSIISGPKVNCCTWKGFFFGPKVLYFCQIIFNGHQQGRKLIWWEGFYGPVWCVFTPFRLISVDFYSIP